MYIFSQNRDKLSKKTHMEKAIMKKRDFNYIS